jgi:hypothetical protein
MTPENTLTVQWIIDEVFGVQHAVASQVHLPKKDPT